MSPAYRAHPEFGYFCLSRRFRRRVLIALTVIGFGAFAGSQVLRSGHETADAGAAAIAPVRAAAADAEAIPAVKPAVPAAAETPAQPETIRSGCEGETWTYLDGRCSASRRKPHGVRGAVDLPPIAAIPLGRSGLPASASPATPKPERLADASATNRTSSRDAAPGGAAPPATTSPTRKVEATPDPVVTAPTSAAPTEQSISASKEKKLRAGRSQNGGRDLEKGNSASRDERSSRSGQRNARADASAGNRAPRRSSTGWAGQLRAGEHLLRALLSAGI